jgi:hypothetical protein
MMKTPLEFDRSASALQWKNGTTLPIKGTWVDTGTTPPGWVVSDGHPADSLYMAAVDACRHLQDAPAARPMLSADSTVM